MDSENSCHEKGRSLPSVQGKPQMKLRDEEGKLKTGKYLGRITPLGLIELKSRRSMKLCDRTYVKEHGTAFFLKHTPLTSWNHCRDFSHIER